MAKLRDAVNYSREAIAAFPRCSIAYQLMGDVLVKSPQGAAEVTYFIFTYFVLVELFVVPYLKHNYGGISSAHAFSCILCRMID